jgi:hypothetical protein
MAIGFGSAIDTSFYIIIDRHDQYHTSALPKSLRLDGGKPDSHSDWMAASRFSTN